MEVCRNSSKPEQAVCLILSEDSKPFCALLTETNLLVNVPSADLFGEEELREIKPLSEVSQGTLHAVLPPCRLSVSAAGAAMW